MLNVPIAFVVFNRPQPTRISFQRIREARPNKLFLISDAARADQDGEAELVQLCRQIAEDVDWDCDVTKIYASANMGCGLRISSGISAAMKVVDRLIVLEDDCIPNPSFFTYCDQLLEKYHDDERVMAISGNNFQQGIRRTTASYYFSKYPHCWGWATWRRAWQHFDMMIPDWPEFRDAGQLAAMCSHPIEIEYWTRIFDKVHVGATNSWAYPWTLTCWMHHGLTTIPTINLVSNIGFGNDATHTKDRSQIAGLPTGSIGELVHPKAVSRHFDADRFTDNLVFSQFERRRNPLRRLGRALRGKAA
jgi:hypothetical protein